MIPHRTCQLRLVETGDTALLSRLGNERPADMPARPADFRRTEENWLEMWIDTGHSYSVPAIHGEAFRAIDLHGGLLWVLRTPLVRISHLSRATDLADAVEETRVAAERRTEIALDWPHVQEIIAAVQAGRLDFECTVDDAMAGGLCRTAVVAYGARHGYGEDDFAMASALARLIPQEPIVVFMIYAAWQRAGSPFPGR